MTDDAGANAIPGRTELFRMFQSTAMEIAEREFRNVTEETRIADLGLDSLGMLELVGSIERTLRIRISDEDLADVQTVANLLDVVEERLFVDRNGGAPHALEGRSSCLT